MHVYLFDVVITDHYSYCVEVCTESVRLYDCTARNYFVYRGRNGKRIEPDTVRYEHLTAAGGRIRTA